MGYIACKIITVPRISKYLIPNIENVRLLIDLPCPINEVPNLVKNLIICIVEIIVLC